MGNNLESWERSAWNRKMDEERKQREMEFDNNNLIYGEEYELGKPDRVIIDEYSWKEINNSYERSVRYYGAAGVIVLFGRRVNCSDLIHCELVDNPTVKTKQNIYTESQTWNNGSGMFGGGILGTYSSRSNGRVSTRGNINGGQTLSHHYSLRINVKDIYEPLIYLDFKLNERAEEVYALVQAVIEIEKAKRY